MIQKLHVSPAFVDERGAITNLLEVPIEHVSLITCKAGAIRGNHHHIFDEHYSVIMSGKAMYYELRDGKLEAETLNLYDMVFSPKGVPHAFWYIHQSVMVSFTTRQRNDGKYDQDTVKQVIFKHPLDKSKS